MSALFREPLFAIALTIVAYAAAIGLQSKRAWLHPLFTTCAIAGLALAVLQMPLADYAAGGQWLSAMLGPATVALAVPLYKQWANVKRAWLSVLGGVTVGTVASMAASWLLVVGVGGSAQLAATMVPKSATSAISIELAGMLGGSPPLTAALTVLTGLLGSMVGPRLLALFGVRSDIAVAVAIGTAAHGIGTAKLIRESERRGGIAGAAMALAGIATALAAIPLSYWLGSGGP